MKVLRAGQTLNLVVDDKKNFHLHAKQIPMHQSSDISKSKQVQHNMQ